MKLPFNTLKQIEDGRRPLPQIIGLDGKDFSDWLERWLHCVKATDQERREVAALLITVILGQLANGLGR